MHAKCAKMCHLYAEIVKFGVILIHLKLFWRQTKGDKNILREMPSFGIAIASLFVQVA